MRQEWIMDGQVQPHGRGRQGFASMDAAKQRAIAAKGGSAVPAEKRPFARNPALAAAAGRKGGRASARATVAAPEAIGDN
jgi:general stress protein YciG